MDKQTAQKIIDITKKTYELIGGDFAETRTKPWPEMEILVQKYVKDGQKVLDLGCGNGRFLEALKGKKIDYCGIDGAKSLVDEAKKKADSWEKVKMGVVDIKYLDILDLDQMIKRDFDVIFMFAAFNHVPSDALRNKVLSDINELLKPGGIFVMTNWNLWQTGKNKKSIWKYKWFSQVHGEAYASEDLDQVKEGMGFRDVMTFWRSRRGDKMGGIYYRVFSRWDLRRALKKNGFKVVENFYSLKGVKSKWWKGRNIVTVGRKK